MSSNAPVTIILLVDGLGWSMVERAGFLAQRLPFRSPVQPVPGYSSAAIPALLTGQPPNRTGKWMLFGRSRSGAGSLHPFAPLATLANLSPGMDRALRKLVNRWCVRVKGWPPHFSCYQVPFAQFRQFQFEDVDMGWAPRVTGGYPTLFQIIEQAGQRLHLHGFPTPDSDSLEAAERGLGAGGAGVYMLYLWQLDSIFHTSFRDPARSQSALEPYEAGIERLYLAARSQFGNARLAVVSDHGMARVTGAIDAMAILNRDARIRRARPVIFYNSTLLQVWCDRPGDLPLVRDALAEIPHAYLLGEDFLRREGIDFPDRRFGDLFLQLEEGWVFHPSYFGEGTPAGMHGYDPTLPDSWAVLLSNIDLGRTANLLQVHDALARLACGPF